MFAPAFARPLVKHSALFSAPFLAVALGAAAPAQAAPASEPSQDLSQNLSQNLSMTITRIPVNLSDLDLATARGRDEANARVRMAARSACGVSMGKVTLQEMQDQQNCFDGAVHQGKVQVALARERVLASR